MWPDPATFDHFLHILRGRFRPSPSGHHGFYAPTTRPHRHVAFPYGPSPGTPGRHPTSPPAPNEETSGTRPHSSSEFSHVTEV
ncbi:hypothetical protein GCM10017673_25930 [Streptosporangium violaceochromogenes]|nr:hypothetical protein GCM10017673_25930 [Streptosporangium violaceochromogenes]